MIILAWVLFLGLITLFFTRTLEQRNYPNQSLQEDNGPTVVLQRNTQGHYLAPGKINNQPVRFLIDTGASNVAIPAAIAAKLSLPVGSQGLSSTANGVTKIRLTRARQISLGGITMHDVPVSVLPNAGIDEVLLGMTFLKHLRISQYDGELTLTQINAP